MAAKITITKNLPALPDGTHPYAVQEIINALSNLAKEDALSTTDLRAIADGLIHAAENRGTLNYQDGYGNTTEAAYDHFLPHN